MVAATDGVVCARDSGHYEPSTHALLVARAQSNLAGMQRTTKGAPQLPWDDVRLFLALCRARTLGEAARRLGVDASTLSRRLTALELSLRSTLFERGRDGIAATEAAQRLLPVAEEMEQVMARFTDTAEDFERNVSGRVRIACPGDTAELLVAPFLPQLLKRYPLLQVDLSAGEGVVDLARREADLALRTARPTAGDLVMTRLFTVQWRVAAAPAVARKIRTLRAWSDVPWLGWDAPLAETTPGRWYARFLNGVEPVVRADRLAIQVACARAGLGVALVPDLSLRASGLVPLKLSPALQVSVTPWPQDDFLLVAHRSLRRVPRVRAVWDFLLEHASQQGRIQSSRRNTG